MADQKCGRDANDESHERGDQNQGFSQRQSKSAKAIRLLREVTTLLCESTSETAKMAVAFANIFMAKIEKEILRQSDTKPIVWKRFIDDVISMWNTSRDKIEDFLLKANSFHPTIKFTAEISETETTFLDTKVYKGVRFTRESILDVRTHFKTTEIFNTWISIRVTHQASRKALSKEKRQGF